MYKWTETFRSISCAPDYVEESLRPKEVMRYAKCCKLRLAIVRSGGG